MQHINKHYLIYGLIIFLFCGGYFSSLKLYAQNTSSSSILKDAQLVDSLVFRPLDRFFWKYFNANQYDSLAIKGKKVWEENQKEWEKTGDSLALARSVYGRGLFLQGLCMSGHYEKLPLGEKVVMQMESLFGQTFRTAMAYTGLGHLYDVYGDKRKMQWAHHQSLRIVENNEQIHENRSLFLARTARRYVLVASAFRELNQLEQSINLYNRAITFYRKSNPHNLSISDVYLQLVQIYLSIKDYPRAKNYLDSLQVRQPIIHEFEYGKKIEIYYYLLLGEYYQSLHYLEKAKTSYDSALTNALEFGRLVPNFSTPPNQLISNAYHAIARFNHQIGHQVEASRTINKAVAYWLKSSNKNNSGWKELIFTKVQIEADSGNWPAALNDLRSVLMSFSPGVESNWRDYDSIDQIPSNLEVLKVFNLKAKILFDVYQKGDNSICANDVLTACILGQQYLEKLVKTFSAVEDISRLFEGNRVLYEIPVKLAFNFYQEQNDPIFLDSLFLMIEKTKAIQLLSAIQGKRLQIKMGLPDKLLKKEFEAQKKLVLYEKLLAEKLTAEERDVALISHYQTLLKAYREEYDGITERIRDSFPSYYHLKYNNQPHTLAETQSYLKSEELLINYFWEQNNVYALAASADTAFVWVVPIEDEFYKIFDDFTELVRDAPNDFSPQSAQKFATKGYYLYQKLLAPGLEHCSQTNLILIPDGLLSYLPWPALTTGPIMEPTSFRELRYLVKTHQLRQEYSATLLQESLPKTTSNYSYLGYAPSYSSENLAMNRGMDSSQSKRLFPGLYREGWPNLVKTIPEVEQAGSYFTDGMIYLEAEATEQAFKSNHTEGNIQHFAMHGFTNDIDPLFSHLAFSKPQDTLEDGNLYAYEIYNMNIPADLAILSACNTGDGAYLHGQGVMSLARAFKYAGCRNVLMSQWRADDEAAYLIISDFFEQLKQQRPQSAALQQAMLQYFQDNKNDHKMHPHYWSGFALIGPGAPLEQIGTSRNWILITAPLLLIIGLFYYLRRNRIFS